MAIYHRNKLYKGNLIDLRDYEISDALKRKKEIVVVLQDESERMLGKMTFTLKMLKNKKLIKEKNIVASKVYPGQHYTIVSYEWKPDKVLTEEELWRKNYID
jgi:hypothetical protein